MPLNLLHHQSCDMYWLFTLSYDAQDIGLHRRIFIRAAFTEQGGGEGELKICREGSEPMQGGGRN